MTDTPPDWFRKLLPLMLALIADVNAMYAFVWRYSPPYPAWYFFPIGFGVGVAVYVATWRLVVEGKVDE